MKRIKIELYEEELWLGHDGLQWCLELEGTIDKRSGKMQYYPVAYFRSWQGILHHLRDRWVSRQDFEKLEDIAEAYDRSEAVIRSVSDLMADLASAIRKT